MKQNDWLVATINNPTYDSLDFQYISGLNLDNTLLLSKDNYLKSQFIRGNKAFKDKEGNFNELMFNDFYKQSIQKFKDFSAESEVNGYLYSMWDVLRPKEGKIKNVNFNLSKEKNPEHISIGISGINDISYSNKSMRELAQNSKIFDPSTGTYLDKSVNDISLWNNPIEYFKSIFDDPLVYATYDQDTEEIDPVTGNKVLHKKGEWKVNEDGEYYTEKLNGRSLIGKQTVSSFDYLTPENSNINKYDFFDSDDLEKSIEGNIAKNITAIIPMLIPYVNVAYSGLLVGREMSKSLPMLYGIINGLSGSDNVDSKLLNTMAAYGQKFSGSSSDYAQSNTFSFENFANLMSDVALLWGLLKFIAQTFSKLTSGGDRAIKSAYAKAQLEYANRAEKAIDDAFKGKLPIDKMESYIGTTNILEVENLLKSGKWAESAFGKAAINKYLPTALKVAESRMKTGQDLSLIYMAIVSNTDVYESVLEKGGTPFEAAAIALGSTIGMFSVDKYLGLGEMFFNEEPARKAIRTAAKKNAEELMSTAGIREALSDTKKGILGLILRGINSGKKAVNDYHRAIKDRTLGFIGKSLGEGLEEVSEELVSDMSKSLGELAGKLGYFSQSDYGAWDNAFDRYAMSFLGGAAGGGLFYGVDVVQNRNRLTQEFLTDLVYLLRLGKKSEILKEFARLKNEGKLGSKSLSYKTEKSGEDYVYLTADNEQDSQSLYIYDTLVKTVNLLDFILNDNQINLSEDEIFDKMVQGEYRSNALSDFLKGDKGEIKELSYITKYLLDFLNLAEAIVNKESEIQALISETSDPKKRDITFLEKLDKLKEEKLQLLDLRDYLFGEGSLGYVEKMLFAIDTNLSGQFLSLNYNQFIRSLYNKSINDLTQAELELANKEWKLYKNVRKNNLDEAFKLFKDIERKVNPSVLEVTDNIENWQKLSLLFIDSFKSFPTIDYDTKLEDETDELYNIRRIKLENETEDQYRDRVNNRAKLIDLLHNEKLSLWIDSMSLLSLDKNQFRTIESLILILKKNKIQEIVRTFQLYDNPELTNKIWNIIELSDLKDIDKLKEDIKLLVRDNIEEKIGLEYSGRSLYDDFTWYKFRDKLYEIGESSEGYLTYGDLYKILEDYRNIQESQGLPYDLENYLIELSNDTLKFDPNSSEKLDLINYDFLQWYSLAIVSDEIRESKWTTPVEITSKYLENEISLQLNDILLGERNNIQEETRNEENGLNHRINKIVDNILNDLLILSLSNLENKAFEINPVSKVVEAISKISTNINIHDFLELIYSLYQNGENSLSFLLTDLLEKTLLLFIDDLKMSLSFIYAASVSSNYETPIGHNKAINQFIANHKDVFKTDLILPEISEEYANFLINEANSFIKEANNWIELSRNNSGNKVKKFITAESKYIGSISKFYLSIRDSLKINPDIDLLEGYETISDPNSILGVAKTELLLHNNYLKAKAKGMSIELILDIILPKITNVNELSAQLTSKLDENLSYSTLTSYHKLSSIINSFALSPKKYYNTLLKFILDNGNIAPLSILEEVAKVVLSQLSDSDLINRTLNYLSDKLKISLPILENTSIVLGLGGAGKSAVIAKIGSLNGENSWLSGPTQTQIDNLLQYLPDGKGKTKEELLTLILGSENYAEFKNSFTGKEDGSWKTNGKFFSLTLGLDGNSTVKLNDNVEVSKIDNPPKLIVIDEATHFNTAELQVISKFAKLNNILVLLLGDDHQNGSVYKGLMMNLDREMCLGWRTPKLFISLRDNNILKYNNLSFIINLIDYLDDSFSTKNEEETTNKIINEIIPNFSFNYYNKEAFYGELITKLISPELTNKLSENIGFIGSSNSETYKQLLEAGKNPILVDPLSVQGLEFDYVVVDKDWNLLNDAPSLYFFLKDLYTMISRSRKGTILIERGDLNKFHSVENDLTGETSIKSAINKFRETRLPILLKISDSLVEEEIINNPEKEPEDIKPTDIIPGTNTTLELLNPEPKPIKDNSSFNLDEKNQSDELDEGTVETITTPIRCYSNISYSGIPIGEIWTNNDDVKKDLGIFVRRGNIIKNGLDKRELVRKLLLLKCIFNYGTSNWDKLSRDIKERFSEESFNLAEYYISVEDPSNNNSLVGLTDLDPNKRTINGKIITLVASIKDKNGEIWEVTLGGLASPLTWKSKEEYITKKILKRIEEGDPKSEELQEYLNNLHSNIISYENKITEISKSNLKFRINTPQFSGLTTLVKSDTELRLESIDPESDAKPFNAACQYALKSDVYVLTGDITGVNPELKGKPVMYVSSNLLLDPSLLKTIYEELKNDPSLVPQVRMIVLDNMGVAFDSLYRKKYKDIYSTAQGETKYYFPMDSEPTGLRMYRSIWNFRSNLLNFLKAYNSFKEESGLSQEDIIKLCKLDNETYSSIRGDLEYISEQEYRSKVDDNTKELLKPIWDFNDSLKDYRQFRLGYSSNNGLYLRKLTNLSEDGPYLGKDLNNIVGVYINPDLAEQYSQVLDKLFTNILDKIIPSDGRDSLKYITKELEKGWYRKVTNDRKISINIIDYSENLNGTIKTGTLNFEKDLALSSILPILVETAKFLEFKSLNLPEVEEYLQQNPEKYPVMFGDERLDWYSIDQVFENDRPTVDRDKPYNYSLFSPGINPYETDPDTKELYGIIDERISNLFNLMFHGLTSTKKYNDFTKSETRATDADFKYGFFIDPVLAPKEGIDNTSALTITNNKLFGASVYPGLPIIGISLNPYSGELSSISQDNNESSDLENINEPTTPVKDLNFILNLFIDNSNLNILMLNNILFTEELIEDLETVEDLLSLVNLEISTIFKKAWLIQSNNFDLILSLPYNTSINSEGKLSINTLSNELKSLNDGILNIKEISWNLGTLIIKTDNGKTITLNQGVNAPIITMSETNNINIENTAMDDLGTLLKLIILDYTLPNNEDGLDADSSLQLVNEVDRVIKKGKLSNDISTETKRRIINLILEALNNTDLEDEINKVMSLLKNVCKI